MEVIDLNGTMLYFANNGHDDSNTTELLDDPIMTESTTMFFTNFDSLTPADYTYIGIYLSMAVLGVILNTLALLAVGLGQSISKDIKIQLMNLAFADLLMALFDPTYEATKIHGNFSFSGNSTMCRFYLFIRRTSHNAPLLCNVAISLERFVIIFFPFRAARYRNIHKYTVILLIWVLAALPTVGILLEARVIHFGDFTQCALVRDSVLTFRGDTWVRTLLVLLPAGVIATVYAMIFVKLSWQKKSGVRRHLSRGWKRDLDKVWRPFIYCVFYIHYKLIYKSASVK